MEADPPDNSPSSLHWSLLTVAKHGPGASSCPAELASSYLRLAGQLRREGGREVIF